MAGNYEVRLDKITALREIERARDGILNAVAYRVEGLTKMGQNVDTGFMSNSTQAIPVDSDGLPGSAQYIVGKSGRPSTHVSNATPATGPATSGVAVGADYSFWQELQNPALGPAADQAMDELDEIAGGFKL